jgi:hypothetical protein
MKRHKNKSKPMLSMHGGNTQVAIPELLPYEHFSIDFGGEGAIAHGLH